MSDRFDQLAKDTAEKRVSRRGVLRKLGLGVGGALVAAAVPATAQARPCPAGSQKCGGAGCCPKDTVCCKIQGAHFCCPTGGVVNLGCPGTQVLAINLGCVRVL